MDAEHHLSAAQIRKNLGHPVIDADGHWIEFGPLVRDELRRIGGDLALQGYSMFPTLSEANLAMGGAEREAKRITQGPWWTQPTRNTYDRATVMLPRLLAERMDEVGFDYMVAYPSVGNSLGRIPDAAMRQATCHAFNIFAAELFRPYADRITPTAVIPMHTPEEAIAELEFVVKQLGVKVVVLNSLIPRSIDGQHGEKGSFVELRGNAAGIWYDTLALDSLYDYDPVWAKCLELKVVPTFHTGTRGIGTRVSPNNFSFNHVGHFAAGNEAVAKAMLIGGVTRRFPDLRVGFLEGGVGYAAQLYADLLGHWEKRSARGLEENNPANVDGPKFRTLAEQYGADKFAKYFAAPDAIYDVITTPSGAFRTGGKGNSIDDFAAAEIDKPEDLRDLFTHRFYFGCEADDPMNALAFNTSLNPYGARLNAIFGSDIGHFDVPDIGGVLPEAYELVEHGLMNTADFRDFVAGNAARLYTKMNPDFFRGTRVEKDIPALLSA